MHGGMQLEIQTPPAGLAAGVDYAIHIGPTGTTADLACYSGVPGQGAVCRSSDGETILCIAPPMARGALVLSIHGNGDSGTSAVTAHEESHLDTVWDMRQHYPPWYDTGPRRLDVEPRQDG